MKIYRHGIHRGEEQYVRGNDRAGMIVLAGCHLRCSFCYTPEASFQKQGTDCDLGQVLGALVGQGARNFNFISPSHVWSEIRGPLSEARAKYPQIPVVLKVSGYEGKRLAREFAELADVVVMDYKVQSEQAARAVDLPVHYGKVAGDFLAELQRYLPFQYGPTGEITRGVIVRTLWLPMAPDEAVSIAGVLSRLAFQGAWNLMRHFIDPVKKQLLCAPKPWESEVRAALGADRGFEIWHGGKRVSEPAPLAWEKVS